MLKRFLTELKQANRVLINRHKIFYDESKKFNIDYYCANRGFFVCIKTKNSQTIYEKLLKVGVYTIPLEGYIRLAISSIPTNKIKVMVDKIGGVINHEN